MTSFAIALALWMSSVGRQTVAPIFPKPSQTIGIPKNEKPRNIRPWTPPPSSTGRPEECTPPAEKK